VGGQGERTWTFLTNHAHVLLVVRAHPDVLLADLASAVGITPRAVQLILADLEVDGYLARIKVGRRNRYVVHGGPMRHPLEQGRAVDELMDALAPRP
jgi:predicted transcriptional regulator